MKKLLLLPLLLSLSGCSSFIQQSAGLTTVDVVPVLDSQGNPAAQEVHIVMGKEYASFSLDFERDENGLLRAKVEAREVGAFTGQALSAEASKALAEEMTKAVHGVAPAVIRSILGF